MEIQIRRSGSDEFRLVEESEWPLYRSLGWIYFAEVKSDPKPKQNAKPKRSLAKVANFSP